MNTDSKTLRIQRYLAKPGTYLTPRKNRLEIGARFSTMVVVGYKSNGSRVLYKVKCDCGREKLIQKHSLMISKSCGCLLKAQISAARTTHGESKTPTYAIWDTMIARCTNPNHKSWSAYGGRGIKVCDSWHKYVNFKADMGERPAGMQLDRIDNSGNYEPSNCRWATPRQNANNRRSSVFLVLNDERLTIAQWARRLGIRKDTLRRRLVKGWSTKKALTMPLRSSIHARNQVSA